MRGRTHESPGCRGPAHQRGAQQPTRPLLRRRLLRQQQEDIQAGAADYLALPPYPYRLGRRRRLCWHITTPG